MSQCTEEQIFAQIAAISRRYYCEDTEEVKQLALSYNKGVSDESKKLHEQAIIIDTCNFNVENYSWALQEGKPTALNVTIPGVKDSTEEAIRNLIDVHSTVLATPELMLIDTADDIAEAKKKGKVGIIFGAQSCEFVRHNDLNASLQLFSKIGLRVMQIAYSHRTFAADGCFTGSNGGLTNDGKKLIRAMENNGVTVDLSHVGDLSVSQALDYVEKPAIISHSNPRARFNHLRNIPDELAEKCAKTGGVVGVSAYPPTLWDGRNYPTIDMVMDNIEYYVKLIGVDHVGIGLDATITPGAYPRRDSASISRALRTANGTGGIRYQSCADHLGVRGMLTEGIQGIANYPNITHHLLKRGFSHEDTRKILGENWLRVFKQTWK